MCNLLTVVNTKIVQGALSGSVNILRFGEKEPKYFDQISEYFPNPTMPLEQFWRPLLLEGRT